MTPVVFAVVSMVGAVLTLLALVRVRHPYWLGFPFMMAGWLTGEHALFHIAWQLVATAVFVALGALGRPIGWVGLAVTLVSWTGLVVVQRRARRAGPVLQHALAEGLGETWRDRIDPALAASLRQGDITGRELRNPFAHDRRGLRIVRDLAYGDQPRNRLDLYVPTAHEPPYPVLVQIHGGAWVSGRKEQQGQPLLHALAAQGWLGVAINYRLGRRATWPDHLVDAKRALAWVREHAAEHGGDPAGFLAVTGGSAGGHLAAMVALTFDDPAFQPGFEDADTHVDACVPFYAPFDLTDRDGLRGRAAMAPFLSRFVMRTRLDADRARWEAASPLYRVRPDAPPFLIVQGTHDLLVYREEARRFAEALRAVSTSPVVYAEIPDAQHAFDVTTTRRSLEAVDAVAAFLAYVRSTRAARAGDAVRTGDGRR